MLANPTYYKAKRSYGSFVLVSAVLLLTLVAGLVCAWLMLQTVASYYANRVYPNVHVMGMKLGRLTPEEATALLKDAAGRADMGQLVLRDGENHMLIPWSEAGMHLDVEATLQAAFAVGHSNDLRWRDRVREWLDRHDVAPLFSLDPDRAKQVLEGLAPGVFISPTDPTVRLSGRVEDPVVVQPGRPGRELDIDATLAQLLTLANAHGQTAQMDLVFRDVPPRAVDVTPLQAQVEEMLSHRVDVSTYDLVTDETFTWTLGRSDIITWLTLMTSSDGPAVGLDQGGIQVTLADLVAELGAGRGFRWAEATEQIADAFNAGGGIATLHLTHPQRTYAVRAGDTLSTIATAFGMTSWHVLKANPDIDPDWLQVGQKLTIPSQDELTPLPPVPGKRIVISTSEQRMRVYEDGELIDDWPVSTGIAESPTHTGVFQVLSKEDLAYASLWDLWMPHFIAIYAAGPGFYNGIHGLPTLSSGRRLWEGLLGSPASYGCIILGLEEAETLYQWAEPGVVVVVE